MSKWRIVADADKCCLCDQCVLLCSLKENNTFNPKTALIRISKNIKPNGELHVAIAFDSRCDGCGICAKYCKYGALSRERQLVETN